MSSQNTPDTRTATTRTTTTRTAAAAVVASAALDLALVALFVLIGRRSHDEGDALLGFLTTLWPFVAAAAIGWLLARAWRRPARILPTGLVVWASTVGLGMLLRIVSGQGVQWSFVIVTAIVLAAFLLGWRAIALLVRRLRPSRGSGSSSRSDSSTGAAAGR